MLKPKVSLKWFVLGGILLLPACGGQPPKPFSTEIIPTEAVAEITEIADRPVWIRLPKSDSEAIATIGRTIKLGESIRTEGSALVQITLRTGVILRMEGDTILSIYDSHRIEVVKGRIVVWVPPQPNITAKILLTGAIASVKNATVYIDLSKSSQIISLEGNIEVLPVDASKPIVVKAGQNLIIDQSRSRDGANFLPKTLAAKELKTEFTKTKLLSGFNSRIGSQDAIASNLKIPINPTDYIIPPNKPAKPTPTQPVNREPRYYEEPYAYERRAEPVKSYRNPENYVEPPTKELVEPVKEDLPPTPVQPELTAADDLPEPMQPEEPKP